MTTAGATEMMRRTVMSETMMRRRAMMAEVVRRGSAVVIAIGTATAMRTAIVVAVATPIIPTARRRTTAIVVAITLLATEASAVERRATAIAVARAALRSARLRSAVVVGRRGNLPCQGGGQQHTGCRPKTSGACSATSQTLLFIKRKTNGAGMKSNNRIGPRRTRPHLQGVLVHSVSSACKRSPK